MKIQLITTVASCGLAEKRVLTQSCPFDLFRVNCVVFSPDVATTKQ